MGKEERGSFISSIHLAITWYTLALFPCLSYRESKNLEESGYRRRLGRCLWVPCPLNFLWLGCCFLWLLSVVTAVPAACGAEDSCIWLHLLNGTSKEIGLISTQNPRGLMTSVVRSDPPHAHTTLLSLVQFLVELDVLMLLWEESCKSLSRLAAVAL